ncbi:MAG: hypothetical protein HRT89_21015 [Lentisphaeria bacterium]|nr:transglutaminase-like domain-containing protein [Lentisphaeria bacterium]NQZ70541.1 hypothetical protein [Lentisphaeria bacterium]
MATLNKNEISALVEMMADPDATEIVVAQLSEMTTDTLVELKKCAEFAPDNVAMMIDQALEDRHHYRLELALKELNNQSPPELLDILLWFCELRNPDYDKEKLLYELDALYTRCSIAVGEESTMISRATKLASYLGGEEELRGNKDDYYNPNNSFIDHVLETRQGLPICLSAIYMLVGEKLKVPFRGLALPGHFVVALFEHPDEEPVMFIDPFRKGLIMNKLDLIEVVHRHGLTFDDEYLKPVSTRYLCKRMLNNLHLVYERQNELKLTDAVLRFSNLWSAEI